MFYTVVSTMCKFNLLLSTHYKFELVNNLLTRRVDKMLDNCQRCDSSLFIDHLQLLKQECNDAV